MAPAEESDILALSVWTTNQGLPLFGQFIRLRNPICSEAQLQEQWTQFSSISSKEVNICTRALLYSTDSCLL